MKSGTSQRDVTPPVGLNITHPVRPSVGVHDPLFVRALVLEDAQGTRLAIVCSDLIGAGIQPCDALRNRIRERWGIEHTLLNFAHPHSSRGFGGYADLPEDQKWAEETQDAFIEVIGEAIDALEPVTLKAGRADVQVGFNRRVVGEEGYVYMAPNEDGPVVPWVNVLLAESLDGELKTVLFQHTAHPVIVPDDTGMTSADYPGIAVATLRETLGEGVFPMFAQGCAGNINGYPLRSSYDHAIAAGQKLAAAVVQAIASATPIASDAFDIRSADADLPTCAMPPLETCQHLVDTFREERAAGQHSWWPDDEFEAMMGHFEKLIDLLSRGETPPDWPMRAMRVSLGTEWGLIAYSHEMFCDYELWVDEHAPFERTMVFNYTNGATGYIPTDAALAMDEKAGYEASRLPAFGSANIMTRHFGPPEVGVEERIHDLTRSLWS